MKPRHLLCLLLLASFPAQAQQLTPEQIESLRERMKTIKEGLKQHASARHATAGERFLQASANPKAAVELWQQCVQMIDFEREDKRDSDFREWKERQAGTVRDPRFLESLMIQLKYLGLSCKAAEAESIDAVFSDLINYVEGLSQMQELPTNGVLHSVANSVFARAYDLQPLLSRNRAWEACPYSISGIYEKTILPHLRKENPAGLMSAWDKRIDQQRRLAEALNASMDKEESRIRQISDSREKGRAREDLDKLVREDQSGMMRTHDRDDLVRETLPRLKWGKMKDQFQYVDAVAAATAMIAYIQELASNPLAEEFYSEFEELIESAN